MDTENANKSPGVLRPKPRGESARLIVLRSHFEDLVDDLSRDPEREVCFGFRRIRDQNGGLRLLALPKDTGHKLQSCEKLKFRGSSGREHKNAAGVDHQCNTVFLDPQLKSISGGGLDWHLESLEISGAAVAPIRALNASKPTVRSSIWNDAEQSEARQLLGGAWDRIRGLRVVLVGAGRLGSLLAEQLVALGVDQLTIIEPGIIRPSILGDSSLFFRSGDVGRSKAVTLAKRLGKGHFTQIKALRGSIICGDFLPFIAGSDILISAVGNAGARLACATLANRFMRVHIDVTEVQLPTVFGARAELDLRLLRPGHGCAHCIGGVGAPMGQALRELTLARFRGGNRAAVKREGVSKLSTSRSLKYIGSGMVIRMIEDFYSGKLLSPAWYRVSAQEGQLSSPRAFDKEGTESCPVCQLLGCA